MVEHASTVLGRPILQHDTNTTVEARWNGILVTNGKLNFEHTINLSKLPTRMNADIRMELGLKFSDLRKISDLLAPEENSDELLLREWLENKYANRDTCCANTNEDSLRSIEMRCAWSKVLSVSKAWYTYLVPSHMKQTPAYHGYGSWTQLRFICLDLIYV